MVNSYCKISINNLELRIPIAPLYKKIQLQITIDQEPGLTEIRF